MTLQFTCGNPDSPVSGQTEFVHKSLKGILINFIIVNNVPENQLNPNPDFEHNYIEGKIKRGENTWSIGDKLIVDYTPCKNCN